MLRIGYVVETHPEDNSVDLVMTDNAERIVGAQVLSAGASRRTGSVDLPTFKPRTPDKWDVSTPTEQDLIAIVGRAGNSQVVLGFMFPQINQVLFKRDGLRINRHESDVYSTLDKDGNFEFYHPSGTYIRIAENPDHEDLTIKDEDEKWETDRNLDKKVSLRMELRKEGAKQFALNIDPDGNVKIETEGKIELEGKQGMRLDATGLLEVACKGVIAIEATSGITLTAPSIDLNEG